MSQAIRQSNLFAAEDWRKIYRAFLQVNFVSYDFDTIRASLVEYIRQNYPEDFNDFIESSEFIAIVDLLAWLGESLAFRVDLNVRENFIDTAERRESILRLAQLLSYTPKRNIAAEGFLKITSVRTNADVFDSNGNNLNGIRIDWNDPNNPDWYEQFVLVLNSALLTSNQFGQPLQSGTDTSNARTQVYEINTNSISNPGVFRFNANIDGQSVPFENVSVDWAEDTSYVERAPNPFGNLRVLYRNDGQGNQSANTGFFTYFKQGTLQFQDYNITIPVENRIIDIDTLNINNSDVWVQNINPDGSIIVDWTKAPSTINGNIIYNDLPRRERDIFSVETRTNDQISVRFADGRFGNVAFGLTRIYYRVSIGERLTIRPTNIQSVNINVPYLTSNNLQKNLTLFVSLQETITNSAPAETDDDVKLNAAQVYYTQNRMVSGEDYNVFPLTQAAILKAKAVNRTYAGHNRFIDINDPTGSYQNTNVIGDDGLIYKETSNTETQVTVSTQLTPIEIVSLAVIPAMADQEFQNFLIDAIKNSAPLCSDFANLFVVPPLFGPGNVGIMWDRITGSNYSTTGRFVPSQPIPVPTLTQALSLGAATPANDCLDIIKEGSLLRFQNAGWVAVHSIIQDGRGPIPGAIAEGFTTTNEGMVRLLSSVEEGDEVVEIFPPIRTTLSTTEIESIQLKIQANATFAIFYNISTDTWQIIDPPIIPPNDGFIYSGSFDYCDPQRKWMIAFEKNAIGGQSWTIHTRGLRYVFESVEDVRFFFVNTYRVVDQDTGGAAFDRIKIFSTNPIAELANSEDIPTWVSGLSYNPGFLVNFNSTIYEALVSTDTMFISTEWLALCPGLGSDLEMQLVDSYVYPDGYIEPRRVLVSFTDTDQDGVVDDPTIFDQLIFGNQSPFLVNNNNLLFWELYTSFDGYEYYRPLQNVKTFVENTLAEAEDAMDESFINLATRTLWNDGDIAYVRGTSTNDEAFYEFNIDNIYVSGNAIPSGFAVGDVKIPSDQILITNTNKFKVAIGRKNLNFLWNHFAPFDQRIDPSVTNIIDLYALISEYDFLMRQYVKSTDPEAVAPAPPTSTQLAIQFRDLNEVKMISDELIWHPVQYKLLFGAKAPEELRARIKVIKLPNATLSDGEIKSTIIELMDIYFEADNWDFGDTFYFSELAAFIHQGLALQVASVVLVPINAGARFGNLYEIKSNPNELFLSAATVNDIDIIPVNTDTALRISQ